MKKILFAVCILIAMLAIDVMAYADEIVLPNDGIYTGLEIMSEEEMEAFHDTIPMIIDVKPNSIALSRLSEEESVLLENVDIAEIGEEMVYAIPGEETILMSTTTEFPLTDAVDVSASLTFPPIGDQGQTNSCMEWSLCYYMLTNNHNVVNNLQAKEINNGVVVAKENNIISPGFIFSLINGGGNNSENYEYVCNAIMTHGSPNADVYDLEITEDSLKRWCTDTDVWHDAIYNKPEKISYEVIDANDENSVLKNIKDIKKLLSNGYAVSISTFVRSFNYTNKTSNGEYACGYMKNDEQGGHAMTIAGYDDDFWIDVNDNGIVDDGELGAFKVINSWGTINDDRNPYKNGYVWMAYDAFYNQSRIVDAPTNRQGAVRVWYYIEPQKNYLPILVAEVELAAVRRKNISLLFNLTGGENNDTQYFPVPENGKNATFFGECYSHECLDVNFLGGSELETATFAFDLTHIVKENYANCGLKPNTKMRLYTSLFNENLNDDAKIELKTFSIIKPLTGEKVACSDTTAMTVGEYGAYKYVDFYTDFLAACDKNQVITIELNSNVQVESIQGNLFFSTPNNETIYPTVSIENDRIRVLPPTGGYEYDSKYELNITSFIRSLGGNMLEMQYKIPVYVLGNQYYFYID